MGYRILGSFTVARGGERLALSGLRQRAVLVSLLLAGQRGVDVEQLEEQVWGDAPPPKPRASLRAYIANLRRILGGPGVLVTEPTGYRLDTDGDVVDAREFERLIQRGRGQLDGGDAAGAVRALDGALVLWRGSPLLDFRDMHFASHEMHRLETLRADAVDARFDAALRLGKSAELIGDLEFELTNNPLRERLWWHLMLAMYRSGRRTDALRAYERAQAVLDGELGVAPGLALQRLASDVRHQSAELDWRPTSSTAGSTEAVGSGPTRLFGRSAETQRLRDALVAASDGHGAVVVLTGDSGMGKTSLARASAAAADALGMATVWAGHAGEGRRPPSWAWTQAIRGLAGQLGRGAAGGLTALPGWWGPATEDADDDPRDGAGFDVLQATVSAVAELASKHPALIVLDDLHRADRFTHDVLELVASSVHRMPLLVVATWQDGGVDRPIRGRTFDRLLSRTDIDAMKLRALDNDATSALIADVSGSPPQTELVSAVLQRTGGNPSSSGSWSGCWPTAAASTTTPATSAEPTSQKRSPG